jgi:hypothetical protein
VADCANYDSCTKDKRHTFDASSTVEDHILEKFIEVADMPGEVDIK